MNKGTVHNRIRELRRREHLKLTQQELADRVGVTRQTIIAIEAEKYAPSLELAFRITAVFELPFESVFQFEA